MVSISLIAAIDKQNGLGKDNALLCHLPADLHHFKRLTLGKPIVMGRKTYESIGRPLPGRLNIVLSHQGNPIEGVSVCTSLAHALEQVRHVSEVMVIGGARVFEEALPLAQQLYLTHIDHQFEADTFFPALDPTCWQCEESIKHARDTKNPYRMTFCRYIRTK